MIKTAQKRTLRRVFLLSAIIIILFITLINLLLRTNLVLGKESNGENNEPSQTKWGCCVMENNCEVTLKKDCSPSNKFYFSECSSIDECERGCCLLYKNNDFLCYPHSKSVYFDDGVTKYYCEKKKKENNANLMFFRKNIIGGECEKECKTAKDFIGDEERIINNNSDEILNFIDVYCNKYLKRKDASKLLSRLTSLFLIREKINENCDFEDIDKEDPYYPFIKKSCEWGIFYGYPDGTFRPNQFITRAEFVVALMNCFYNNIEFTDEELNSIKKIKLWDVDKNHWAYEELKKALFLGLLHGYPDGTIRPNRPISCKEVEEVLNNTALIKTIKGESRSSEFKKMLPYLLLYSMIKHKDLFGGDISDNNIEFINTTNIDELERLVNNYKILLWRESVNNLEVLIKNNLIIDKKVMASFNDLSDVLPIGLVMNDRGDIFFNDLTSWIYEFFYNVKDQKIVKKNMFKGALINFLDYARIKSPIGLSIDLNNNLLYVVDMLDWKKRQTRILKCSFTGSCSVYKESKSETKHKKISSGIFTIGFFNNGKIMLRINYEKSKNSKKSKIHFQYYKITNNNVVFKDEKSVLVGDSDLLLVKKIIPIIKLSGNTKNSIVYDKRVGDYKSSLITGTEGPEGSLTGFLVVLSEYPKNGKGVIFYYPINKDDKIRISNEVYNVGTYKSIVYAYTINSGVCKDHSEKGKTNSKSKYCIKKYYLEDFLFRVMKEGSKEKKDDGNSVEKNKINNNTKFVMGLLPSPQLEDFLPLEENKLFVIKEEESRDYSLGKERRKEYILEIWKLSTHLKKIKLSKKEEINKKEEEMVKEDYKKYRYNSKYSLLWPIKARPKVYWKFGPRRLSKSGSLEFHTGIDIDDPGDKNDYSHPTPIRAVYDGYVVRTRGGCPDCSAPLYWITCLGIRSNKGRRKCEETKKNCYYCNGKPDRYGNFVRINHGKIKIGNRYQTLETVYAHLNKVLVKPGERVKRGQIIGYMGSSGRSTDMHLHFEVWINGRLVDPLQFYSGILCRKYDNTYEECS